MLDWIFRNATIIDGTGAPGYLGSVGVQGGKLVAGVSPDACAAREIDCTGRYLAPGFLDAHSHGDLNFDSEAMMLSKVGQGVTTQIGGQCGASAFPVSPEHLTEYATLGSFTNDRVRPEAATWTDFSRFLAFADRTPSALNTATFVGHNTLRSAVMGFSQAAPTERELADMCALLDECMRAGALGLSTGLIYVPGCAASYGELLALLQVIAPYGGIYVTHMRNEADDVTASVAETLRLGREANVRVWISHHKVAGVQNWGRSRETVRLVDEAVAAGQSVTLDQYPFLASMTELMACFPPKRLENGVDALIRQLQDPAFRAVLRQEMCTKGDYESTFLNAGSFERIAVACSERVPEAEGLRLSEYAARVNKDPFDAMFDLWCENRGVVNGIYFTMGEEDVCRIFMNPNTTIGSDGIVKNLTEKTHPRAFATFPQAVNFFVKEKKLLSLEACIHKCTGLTAERLGFMNKGRIADGLDADLVLFDLDGLSRAADFADPTRRCDGILRVLVAGEEVYRDGALTGARPGRWLRRAFS